MANPSWDETEPVGPSWDETEAVTEKPWYSLSGEGLFQGLKNVPENIDKFTGAPIRKFITEKLTGETLDKAPTGHDQATRMGVSDVPYADIMAPREPDRSDLSDVGSGSIAGALLKKYNSKVSPADVAGMGLEMVQDPLLLGAGIKKGLSGAADIAKDFVGSSRPGAKQVVEAAQEQAAKAGAEGSAKSIATISGGETTVEHGGQMFGYKAPQSLDELRQWKPEPGTGNLPGKERLKQIESSVPDLKTKPLKYHYDMMENPKAMKELKLNFENLPTEDAKQIAAYNQSMVDESASKITKTIDEISGDKPRHISDAGNDFISTVKDKYHAEKDALGPAFEEIQKRGGALKHKESRDLIEAIRSETKVGDLLKQDETGRYFLDKNKPRSGMSDSEHNMIGRVIEDMNDGMSFKEIQQTRDFLRKAIDPANPQASAEISKVRSVLLGQLEAMASARGPDVGATFKSYAINERARENIEKIIGGKIESLDAMFAANPDKIVHKIFSNPNYSKVVTDYVGPEKMNGLVSSYIQNGLKKSFDPATGFNPSGVRNWLKSNETFLRSNVSPEVAQRLSSLADYGYYGKRFLDEVNPSGTAASLKSMLEPKSLFTKIRQNGPVSTVMSEVGNRVGAFTSQKQATRALNEGLGGLNPTVGSYLSEKYGKYGNAIESKLGTAGEVLDSSLAGQAENSFFRNIVGGENQGLADQQDAKKPFDKVSTLEKVKGTKYYQVLQNAAQKGDAALSSAIYVLGQRDPEYRKLMNNKNQPGNRGPSNVGQ